MKRVMLVFGTRPEAVKMAPLIHLLRTDCRLETIVTVTAQHREMLDQVLQLFSIVPDHDLAVLRPGQTLTDVTVAGLTGLGPVLEAERPDAVVVQGDTTTTLVGALASFYRQIPVVHLEAGLRTGNTASPYPEEMNRCLTTRLSSLHLAATATGRANLLREGVAEQSIVVTGNTVIDALKWAVRRPSPYCDQRLEAIDASGARIVAVTAHRRESWGEGLRSIGTAVADIARRRPDVQIVFPIHRNPVVRETILPAVAGLNNVTVTEPLGYGEFARLLQRCTMVLTDSGGVQEEAPSLGKPVLVMRNDTERPEAVEAGAARLVGTDRGRIVSEATRLLDNPCAYVSMATAGSPYGDGHASERAVAAIAHLLGLGGRPTDFVGVC